MFKVEAVVFDWDGTIVDLDERELHCINKALSRVGLSPMSLQSYIEGYYSHPYAEIGARNLIRKRVGNEALASEAIGLYRDEFGKTVHLTGLQEGAFEALQTLKDRDFRIAVSTLRRRRALVEQEMRHLKIDSFVDVLVTAMDVELPPETTLSLSLVMALRLQQFQKTFRLLQTEPAKTFIVSDSWWDIRAAKQVKAKAVWVKTGFGEYNDFTKENPDITVRNLQELLKYVRQ